MVKTINRIASSEDAGSCTVTKKVSRESVNFGTESFEGVITDDNDTEFPAGIAYDYEHRTPFVHGGNNTTVIAIRVRTDADHMSDESLLEAVVNLLMFCDRRIKHIECSTIERLK